MDGRIASRAAGEQVPWPDKSEVPARAGPADDAKYELTDEDREWVRHTVASLPPLTDRQRDILALLLYERR
jgi:hypothetical protein